MRPAGRWGRVERLAAVGCAVNGPRSWLRYASARREDARAARELAGRPAMPDNRSRRLLAALTAAALSAITGVVSYNHGLDVVRWTGTTGYVAYLVPMLLVMCWPVRRRRSWSAAFPGMPPCPPAPASRR